MSKTFPWNLLAILVLGTVLGCGASAQQSAEQESKIIAKIGNAEVAAVTLKTGFDVSQLKMAEQALQAIKASPPLVAARIEACRKQPHGTPAELQLVTGVEFDDLQTTFGPFSAKSKRNNAHIHTDCDYYTYGNLELGTVEKTIVSVVIKR